MLFLVTIIGLLRDLAGTKRPESSSEYSAFDRARYLDWKRWKRDRRSYIRLVTGAQLASLANSRYSRIGGSYRVRFSSYGGGLRALQINAKRGSCQTEPSQVDSSDSGALSLSLSLSLSFSIQVSGIISKWQNYFTPLFENFLQGMDAADSNSCTNIPS